MKTKNTNFKMSICFALSFFLILLTGCGSSSSSGGSDSAGDRVNITTDSLPNGQQASAYTAQIMVTGGSEDYIYSAENLPKGLSINEDGMITGVINIVSGDYICKVIVKDKNYETNIAEKQFTIVVANYLEDDFEPINVGNSGDPIYENTMIPGDTPQSHTFHVNGDEDFIKLDLTGVTAGDVVLIATSFLTASIDTNLSLYNDLNVLIQSNNDTPESQYAVILFQCDNPGYYSLKVEEWDSNVGDYLLKVVSSGLPLNIVNTQIVAGITGGSYTEKIEADGGSGDYIYTADNLPNNLVIDEDGNLTGTITATAGDYTINFTATDILNTEVKTTKSLVLNILAPLTITTDSLPDALRNSAYTATITATGGSENYVFSVENLPGNLNISTSGTITGNVAVVSGNYTFKVIVIDGTYSSVIAEKNITVEVVDFLPDDFEQSDDNDFTTTNIIKPGDEQSHSFNYPGDEDYYVVDLSSVTAGSIISIQTTYLGSATDTTLILFNESRNLIGADSNGGVGDYSKIVFTCTTPGIYYLKTEETHSEIGDYIISVVNTGMPVSITTPSIPNGLTGASYLAQITMTGGSGSYVVSNTGLPNGLTMTADGLISGTIGLLNGSYDFTVIVEDAENNDNRVEEIFSLIVVDYYPDVYEIDSNFTTSNAMLPDSVVQNHSFHNTSDEDFIRLDLTGVNAGDVIQVKTEYLSSTTDTNIQLYDRNQNPLASDNNTGADNYALLLYQCDTPEIYYVRISEWNRNVGDYAISVTNTGTAITITSTTIDPAVLGLAYNTQLFASGSTNDFSFTTINLPASLVIGENSGIITGTISTTPGEYQFILTVSDTTYPEKKTSKEFTLNIISNLEIATETIPDALTGSPYSTQLLATGGSENYLFTAINLPASLTVSTSGLITGDITVNTGGYSFIARVTDTTANITVEKLLILTIVDFYPDEHETAGDDDLSTINSIQADSPTQHHTINYPGDEDFIRLDLTGVAAGDMIKINTSFWTQLTDTYMTLYHADGSIIESNNNDGATSYSQIIYKCDSPGIYYVSIETVDNNTGDYSFTIVNTGQGVQVTTTEIPDVLHGDTYSLQIEANGGSGNFLFTATNLPASLTISDSGLISGAMTVNVGSYPFTVQVEDTTYSGIVSEKNYTLNVVDFFPDTYEISGDNDFTTTNTMQPGDPEQAHSFNYIDDEDFIRLDLTGVNAGDVILIKTNFRTASTDTYISLYNAGQNFLTADNNSGTPAGYSQIIYECTNPGIYYAQINEANHETGDFTFSIVNTGPKVEITTAIITDALKATPYTASLEVVGGSGNYLFTATNLPANLTISTAGVLSGTINTVPGLYTLHLRVDDTTFNGIYYEKDLTLSVVDFFPDTHEISGDNNFTTTNTMNPGGTQTHTFNFLGDEDYIKINLNGANAGDVIVFETSSLTQTTNTNLILYNSSHSLLAADDNSGAGDYSKIIFTCNTPGYYYLKVNETLSQYGDYNLSIINTGERVQISTSTLADALRLNSYSATFQGNGGSGSYQFSATSLPASLSVNSDGLLSGNVTAAQNTYTFSVSIVDSVYTDNNHTKSFTLNVMDFFPDSFESNDTINNSKSISQGESQNHNFHTISDADYLKLDLTGIAAGHVVKVETFARTKVTDTLLYLYNASQNVIANNNDGGSGNYSKISFVCPTPAVYYLKVENTQSTTGDYGIRVVDCGSQLGITTSSLPYAESTVNYDNYLQISGGRGSNQFSIVDGTLPLGLNLDASTGRIHGQTYTPGNYNFTVRVQDSTDPENYADRGYSVDTYIGSKLIVNNVSAKPWLSGQYGANGITCEAIPTIVNAPHGVRFEPYDMGVLQSFFTSGDYNSTNGEINMTITWTEYDDKVVSLPFSVQMKAIDTTYPNNFDIVTYTFTEM